MLSPVAFCAFFIFGAALAQNEVFSPVISTATGKLRGKLIKAASKSEFEDVYQFTAIPFAEPPVDNLRFKKPVPKKPWNGVFDAISMPTRCYQTKDDVVPKSEDCLVLNIWVSKRIVDAMANKTQIAPLATFFWIHGGAYQKGSTSSTTFNGTALAASQNVIVVTTQYRLGGFGFLYMANQEIPGNAGLWDQLEALKWTFNNIASFGGDKTRITIDGQSAGASAASFHILSNHSRSYYARAIVQSGTSFSTRSYIIPKVALESANLLITNLAKSAKSRNFTLCLKLNASSPVDAKVTCLRSLDAANFHRYAQGAAPDREDYDGFGRSPFVPVVDSDFFTDSPFTMNLKGQFKKMPLLTGGTTDEGSFYLNGTDIGQRLLPTWDEPNKPTDGFTRDTFKEFVDTLYPSDNHINVSYNAEAREAMESFYWNNRPQDTVVQKLVQMAGDYAIHCPTANHVDVHAESDFPVYRYLFAQKHTYTEDPEWFGCTHADELRFVFGQTLNSKKFTTEEKNLTRRMMTYFMNFVKFGDPNKMDTSDTRTKIALANWPPYELSEKKLIHLINDGAKPQILSHYKAAECKFWNDFQRKYTYPKGTSVF